MPDPTPGQIAYTAWHAIVIPAIAPGYADDWSQISDVEQRAWEAAAQAVAEKAITDLLEVQRILADAEDTS